MFEEHVYQDENYVVLDGNSVEIKPCIVDHCTHVPVPVAQSSAESEYNAACTAGMA